MNSSLADTIFQAKVRYESIITNPYYYKMLTIEEAVNQRHSIRSYIADAIPQPTVDDLRSLIAQCNSSANLNIQLVLDEPKAFGSFLFTYGMFKGVRNYLVLAGPQSSDLDYRLGYYGAQVMLRAKQLGLDSCWVGATYHKVTNAFTLRPGDKVRSVIALGYGNGKPVNHRVRKPEEVADLQPDTPQWFRQGVLYALKAPTAINQQKFHFELRDNRVCQSTGWGSYTQMDLGIVRYFFEIGAGNKPILWDRSL